jgi:hypothetical protein
LERKEEAYQNKGVITSLPVQQNIAAGNTNGGAVLGAGKIAVIFTVNEPSKRCKQMTTVFPDKRTKTTILDIRLTFPLI